MKILFLYYHKRSMVCFTIYTILGTFENCSITFPIQLLLSRRLKGLEAASLLPTTRSLFLTPGTLR